MSIRGWRSYASLAACLVAFPFVTTVADDTGTLSVSATVPKVCKIDSVAAMGFGPVSATADTDSSANILWRCSKSSTTEIHLNSGGGPSIAAREMAFGPVEKLGYQLYTDNGYGTVWGDGTDGSAVTVTGQGMGAPSQQTTTIYGRVTSAQTQVAAEGAYIDSVTVTILF